jgi:hypothetical protein
MMSSRIMCRSRTAGFWGIGGGFRKMRSLPLLLLLNRRIIEFRWIRGRKVRFWEMWSWLLLVILLNRGTRLRRIGRKFSFREMRSLLLLRAILRLPRNLTRRRERVNTRRNRLYAYISGFVQ